MIQPVLFKTTVYWAVVFLVRFLEKLIEYLFAGGTLSGIPEYVATHFTWYHHHGICASALARLMELPRSSRPFDRVSA
jgi:hypothetical protein